LNEFPDRREILISEGLGFLFGMSGEVFADEAAGFLVIAFDAFVAGEIVGDGVAGVVGEHGEAAEKGDGIGAAMETIEYARQSVGGGSCIGMFQSEGSFVALQSAAVERVGSFVVAFVAQEKTEIVDAVECRSMLRPEGFFPAVYGAAVECLGPFVIAFVEQEIPEIVDAAECRGMLRPEGFFVGIQGAAVEHLGPFVIAFVAQEKTETSDAPQRSGMLCPEGFFASLQGAAVEWLGPVVVAFLA
jgi:hypothetical protein